LNPLRRLDRLRVFDFLSPLALRLYLAPLFLATGLEKATNFEQTVAWFGNPEWGLGLPAPWLNAFMATATELVGAVLLLLGLGVRFVSIPLMVVMIVAAVTVHAPNGWFVIADPVSCLFRCEGLEEAALRLERARELLQAHGHYAWLTEKGSFAVINNGVELVVAYFIMLLTLFFQGAGRHVSLDHWIARRFARTEGVSPRGGPTARA